MQDNYSLGSTTVVLIDVQPWFMNRLNKETRKHFLKSIDTALRFCGKIGLPLIVVENPRFGETVCELRDAIHEITHVEYIKDKSEDCAFYRTALEKKLRRLCTRKILLTGLFLNCCVFDTARTGLNRGFEILTARNLMATVQGSCVSEHLEWYQRIGVLYDTFPP